MTVGSRKAPPPCKRIAQEVGQAGQKARSASKTTTARTATASYGRFTPNDDNDPPNALPATRPHATTRAPHARRRRPHTAREPWCGCRRRMRPPWEDPEQQALREHQGDMIDDLPGSCEGESPVPGVGGTVGTKPTFRLCFEFLNSLCISCMEGADVDTTTGAERKRLRHSKRDTRCGT